ncbi:putative F-box protein at5g55150 [Phtheirospermum japonicum]|uniref:Putative F-box protein at5g55150 n=1 Tax=Phtheirospermum japonicum TaxID=374723 RepID=A0A830B8H3_9LAMI|nr:putative F-box protein at5g55150 [Phtheirospermum japonicum]
MSSRNLKTHHLNWLDLPIELWAAIAKKHATSIHDYLTFRGVCNSWRSIATFENFDSATPRVPWLMYASSDEKKEGKKKADKNNAKKFTNLFDLSTNKAHKLINFSPTDRKRYLSCGGWILCVSEGNGEVCLAHPVWRAKIELPGLDTFPGDGGGDRFIRKMVLSGSPKSKVDDFVVMVIWGKLSKRLGFSRPGDKSWTVIDGGGSFSDIIYHNGKLYAVDSDKTVVECDILGPNPTHLRKVFSLPNSAAGVDALVASRAARAAAPPPLVADVIAGDGVDADRLLLFLEQMCYLVESCGKFLIVIRHTMYRKTIWFEVFEFDLNDGSHKEITQFDQWNKAMFLGFNSSVCVELSEWNVVKPNCIYFTDDHSSKGAKHLDMGVFSLSSMLVTTRGLLDRSSDGAFLTPPTWVMPSF